MLPFLHIVPGFLIGLALDLLMRLEESSVLVESLPLPIHLPGSRDDLNRHLVLTGQESWQLGNPPTLPLNLLDDSGVLGISFAHGMG